MNPAIAENKLEWKHNVNIIHNSQVTDKAHIHLSSEENQNKCIVSIIISELRQAITEIPIKAKSLMRKWKTGDWRFKSISEYLHTRSRPSFKECNLKQVVDRKLSGSIYNALLFEHLLDIWSQEKSEDHIALCRMLLTRNRKPHRPASPRKIIPGCNTNWSTYFKLKTNDTFDVIYSRKKI